MFIASELGRAAGERVDLQLLNGAGTSGETRGFLNLSGTVATSYTDASPTVAELCSKLGNNYADISTNYGRAPDTCFTHVETPGCSARVTPPASRSSRATCRS